MPLSEIHMSVLIWILAIIATEALVELITTASIFDVPRAKLMAKSPFLEELLACGYCTSVWIAAAFAWALPGTLGYWWLDILIKTLALHRASNIFHELRGLIQGGIQINHLVHRAEQEDIDDTTWQ